MTTNESARDQPLLRLSEVRKSFAARKRGFGTPTRTLAVDDVSLEIPRGTTLALVGESGSGKTTVGRLILQLEQTDAGSIHFDGEELRWGDSRQEAALRSRIQPIFQDPYGSLNPSLTVEATLNEVLKVHRIGDSHNRNDTLQRLMRSVGLDSTHRHRKAAQLSGGQRQRVGIARALAVHPELIVADEPCSALDVSMQAQILNLLRDLQEGNGLTFLFITHDLLVARYVSHSIAVMYKGRIVERGSTDDVFDDALHPYTQALLSAAPRAITELRTGRRVSHRNGSRPQVEGEPHSGCRFSPVCRFATKICRESDPESRESVSGHEVACYLYEGPGFAEHESQLATIGRKHTGNVERARLDESQG